MSDLAVFLLGVLAGAAVASLIAWIRRRDAADLAREAVAQSQSRQQRDLDAVVARVRDAFGALSLEALSKGTAELVRLANETLAKQTQAGANDLSNKKESIDQALREMGAGLQGLQGTLAAFEKDRVEKYSEISTQLRATAEQTGKLQDTANALRTALAGAKARGQWGERMAEDVLRLAGLVENVNYRKQKALESSGGIPDYTFLLPKGQILNMDVKFPLDNYLRCLEAQTLPEREGYKQAFLRDVRDRVREVTTRSYIDPSANTLDYVLVFIPNEQVYGFINESDHDLLDEALRSKVVLCSPLTLYAVLVVVREAVDNFNVERTAGEVLSLLSRFDKQWRAFVKSFDRIGEKLTEAHDEYERLVTTRRRQLERPLEDLKELRASGRIPAAVLSETEDDEPEAPEP